MIDQYERVLGQIEEGWTDKSVKRSPPIQVCRTVHAGDENVHIYSTLGLSSFPLRSRTQDLDIYVEFSVCLTSDSNRQWVPNVLMELANQVIRHGSVPHRGDLVETPLLSVQGTTIGGFYVTVPLFLNEGHRAIVTHDKEIAVIWLIPLTAEEIELSKKVDWREFEDYLENYLEEIICMPRRSFAI